jgi:hypothetical protein
MLAEALRNMRGDLNASKRITIKSEIALEDSIPILYEIAHDQDAQSNARVDAVKTMAQLAGRNAKEGGGGNAGPGFSININFAGDDGKTKKVIIDGSALPELTP